MKPTLSHYIASSLPQPAIYSTHGFSEEFYAARAWTTGFQFRKNLTRNPLIHYHLYQAISASTFAPVCGADAARNVIVLPESV